MPTASSSRSKKTDRLGLIQVPSVDVVYVVAGHIAADGEVLNKCDVLKAPPGDYPKGVDDPKWENILKEKSLPDCLEFIAKRLRVDLKEYPTEGPPATVSPIKKAGKTTAAAKKRPLNTAAVARRKATAPAKKAPVRKAPAKKVAARRTPARRTPAAK